MSNVDKRPGIQPAVREEFKIRDAAMAGDIVMTINPLTVNRATTTSAFTRNVLIQIETSTGLVHDWLDADYSTTLSIGDTSVAGTASIVSTTLSIIDGQAIVVVTGDTAAWLAAETDTLTIGNITVLGVTVTGGTSVETFI